MNPVILIVLIAVIALLAMLIIPQWRLKRTIPQVIRIFREYNAISIKNAKTIDEMGLKPRNMLEGILKGRDYRQYAVSTLMKVNIIQMTEEGKLYLSEDKLFASGLGKSSPYSR